MSDDANDNYKPLSDDARAFDPEVEPQSAKAWLNLLEESEKAFEDWNAHCDRIDKQYASLLRLADNTRDKEFQMFWANAEVLKPSIYAKPPIPVVVPKFKDRKPLYQSAAEVAERCAIVAFDLADIDGLMKLVRDDLALIDRGVAWCRYEGKSDGDEHRDYEYVCIDFKERRDFLHSLSRSWREVTWVAAASYLTREEARERFQPYSGEAYMDANYKVDRDANAIGGTDRRQRAKFWEIWDKDEGRVVWVAEGCDVILDEDDPHLELRNFFPCPKPAYGTCQRGSLVPVPDVLQYKDQLEELNLLTGKIHALSDALEAKGFYPAGGGEIADAVQNALSIKTSGRVLVPINNWATFGNTKEPIIWMPIEQIAQTITALVMLRKQVIDDIYQIMGLSDIMRGATNPEETLGAQQLKTQYGSTRTRDKQYELVRIARDLVEITVEIITEKFSKQTIVDMSQTDLPTMASQKQQVAQIQQQLQMQQEQAMQIMQSPQAQQMAQQNPQQAQQLLQQFQMGQQQAQAQIQKIMERPSLEAVLKFLSDYRAKAFVLDIETDSTIQLDENAEKQRRTEFTQVLAQLLPQIAQMITAEPATADFCGELLKFTTAPFRAGRSLDGAIDNLVELMKQKGDQPKQNPEAEKTKALVGVEQEKIQAQKQRDVAENQLKQQELKQKDEHKKLELQNQRQIEAMRLNAKQGDQQAKAAHDNMKAMHDREAHQADMMKSEMDMALTQQKGQLAQEQMSLKRSEMQQRQTDRQNQQALRERQAMMPRRQ